MAEEKINPKINEIDANDLPDYFCDPITLKLMEDPVISPVSGRTYDKNSILTCLAVKAVDPFSQKSLKPEDLIPNIQLKEAIEAWKKNQQILKEKKVAELANVEAPADSPLASYPATSAVKLNSETPPKSLDLPKNVISTATLNNPSVMYPPAPGSKSNAYKIIVFSVSNTENCSGSNLVTNATQVRLNSDFIPTIGVDFKKLNIIRDGENILLRLWDFAGQEKFRMLSASYLKMTHGIVLLCDLSEADTLNKLTQRIKDLKASAPTGSMIPILIAAHSDPAKAQVIPFESLVDSSKNTVAGCVPFCIANQTECVKVFDNLLDIIIQQNKLAQSNNQLSNLQPFSTSDEKDKKSAEAKRDKCSIQ